MFEELKATAAAATALAASLIVSGYGGGGDYAQ
jgi:hypothetical protein